MAVILLPLHMPATHWVPQRLSYAPIPKVLTPTSGVEPRPELDYWEFAKDKNQALRIQFRMPDGYDNSVNPIFSFSWFTPDGNEDDPLCKIGQAWCSIDRLPNGIGVGTLTTLNPSRGMRSTDAGGDMIDAYAPLLGTNWVAGCFSTIVFYRNADGSDPMDAVLNFLGGDLLIGLTKEMG